jgi:hypothetical protein
LTKRVVKMSSAIETVSGVTIDARDIDVSDATVLSYDPENRDMETRETEKELGEVAERAFEQFLLQEDIEYVKKSGGYDTHDYLVYFDHADMWLKVDVKGRKGWMQYKDCIVQCGNNGQKLIADMYVQVFVSEDFTTAKLTGWATRHDVKNSETFGGRRNEHQRQVKKMVNHDDLRPLSRLTA